VIERSPGRADSSSRWVAGTVPSSREKRYEDWELAAPAGKSLEEVRVIRDEIGLRVRDLLARLGVAIG
jgi:hypothetical protein